MKLVILLAIVAFAIAQDGEDKCGPPLMHGKLGENWPLRGISKKTRPVFKMKIKGTQRGGTALAGAKLRVILIASNNRKSGAKHAIKDFFIKATNNATDCTTGAFRPNRKGRVEGKPYTSKDCPAMVSRTGGSEIRRSRAVFTAPDCGCVTFRAEVQDADGSIFYEDEDEVDEQYRRMITQVCVQ